jgi:nucleobase:cation symporter-1, NCS1 family
MLVIPFAALFLTMAWLTADKFALTDVKPGDWSVFLGGVALTASASGLGWSPNAADYSRYLRPEVSRRSLVAWVSVGGALPQCLLMLLGAGVAMVVPTAADPISGLPTAYPVWFVVPYLVFLTVQMITLNAVDLYSSGVTLQAIGVRIGRWQAVLLDGVICAGVGLAVVLSDSFSAFVSNFLLLMIVWFAPWAAVFVVDYVLRRGHYDLHALSERGPGFLWRGMAAQVAGAIASLLWLSTTIFTGPLAAATGLDLSVPAGLIVGGLTYYLTARRTVGSNS